MRTVWALLRMPANDAALEGTMPVIFCQIFNLAKKNLSHVRFSWPNSTTRLYHD